MAEDENETGRRPATLGAVLARYRGIGPGFDMLRILLSLAIFYGHAMWAASMAGGPDAYAGGFLNTQAALVLGGWAGPKRPLHVALVPMFFALSGFLVTGSALRLRSVPTFLANRALRIFPALAVELTLSALLLGLFFTALPLRAYFSSPDFFRYAGNLIGVVSMHLPGVFEHNPGTDVVNANLWTLPGEFDCYLITAVMMALGLFYRRRLFTILFLAVSAVLVLLNSFTEFSVTTTTFPVDALAYYFLMGVMFYQWRDCIPASLPWFLIASAMSYLLLLSHHTDYLAAPFVTYVTVWIGLVKFPKLKLVSSGDYSYGIYLYGFPITQALVAAVPSLKGHGWLVFFGAGALTYLFALISWHLIERPTLALKRYLPARYFPTGREFLPGTGQPRQRPS